MADELTELRDLVRVFAAERDWDQFHSPKNLSMALAGEAGELLEQFQWLSEEESRELNADQHDAVAMELADILIYLVRITQTSSTYLCWKPLKGSSISTDRSTRVELARGSAKKYTELRED